MKRIRSFVSLMLAIVMVLSCFCHATPVSAASLKKPAIRVASENNNPKITISKVSGAKGYVIYRKTKTDTKWQKVATINKTTYIDKSWKAIAGTKISYSCKAYKKSGKKTIYSKMATAQKWIVPSVKTVEEKEDTDTSEDTGIKPLLVVRNYKDIKSVGKINAFDEFWANGKISENLSDSRALTYSLGFSNATSFPKSIKLPEGYDSEELLEWGKYPGLDLDILHEHGFTGKGAVIAYIDQPIASHEQYTRDNVHNNNNSNSDNSMHGPAVLSLLTGKDIGTAPEAEVYFYGHSAWLQDQTTHAECLYQIIEQNKKLPDDKKIRMVGFSDNIDESEKNAEAFEKAAKACEDAGVMVWFCAEYGAFSFVPNSDKNSFESLVPDSWRGNLYPDLVCIPASGRTTAGTTYNSNYIYWGKGGLSWTMPYALGLYAIAIEIDPTLTQDELRSLFVDSAYINAAGNKIVNPVGFVASVLKKVGRNIEAKNLTDAVKERTKYLYAVMDTAAMTDKDLEAVGNYLASITDATVLVVDAAKYSDAKGIYTAMKDDAKKRGGTVAGVQLFGTPSMAPAFNITYKVLMANGEVDDGGTLLTDFFYSNFNNDPAKLGEEYNVMDHMANGWNVDLNAKWPVVRLPLSKGEFSAFFERYNKFAVDTELERLDIVNFSNPIFAQKDHSDSMGKFLSERMDKEYKALNVPYRLYGNLKGDYPVDTKVLGGFEAENLTKENKKDDVEFIINSHGQSDNIDNAIFVNGKEERISLVNMDNINKVLGNNPYYLDTWTCNNGYGMSGNLTTTALNGQCVGMFSATTIISNNGVNWKASVSDMKNSNFYYFYYQYLKALNDGCTRSEAFFVAQREYGKALLEDSKNGIRKGEGNYQFNLYNLLTYHNFGVIEPNAVCIAMCDNQGLINQSAESVQKVVRDNQQPSGNSAKLTDGNPIGEIKQINFLGFGNDYEKGGKVHELNYQYLDNDHTRFTMVYTFDSEEKFSIFSPPNGDVFMLYGVTEAGVDKATFIFDISNEHLAETSFVSMKFFNIGDYYISFGTADIMK